MSNDGFKTPCVLRHAAFFHRRILRGCVSKSCPSHWLMHLFFRGPSLWATHCHLSSHWLMHLFFHGPSLWATHCHLFQSTATTCASAEQHIRCPTCNVGMGDSKLFGIQNGHLLHRHVPWTVQSKVKSHTSNGDSKITFLLRGDFQGTPSRVPTWWD